MDQSHLKRSGEEHRNRPLNSSFPMAPLLQDWIGEQWISRSIQGDSYNLSMSEIQRVVGSLLPDVPLECPRKKPNTAFELMVVDRDVFALELAREWVRSGLARSPLH